MKIGPVEIAFARSLATDAPKGPAPEGVWDPETIDNTYEVPDADQNIPGRVEGAAGTVNVHGFLIQEEYNRELRGLQGIRLLDRMFRSDACVQEAYFHITYPLRNASWQVQPASDDPLDHEVAEFVRRALFEWLNQPWQEFLAHALRYLRYGHALFEHTWQVVDAALEFDNPDEPGATVTRPSRQFLTFDQLQPRLPYTIWKWYTAGGKLDGVMQRVWKDDRYVNVKIPADQLILFMNEREGDDWTGTSILRAAYAAWHLKTVVEKTVVIAIERHGVGVLTGYLPASKRDDVSAMERLEAMLAQVRSGEYSFLALPEPKATGQQDGYLVEILSPGSQLGQMVEVLQYFRGEIKGAILARFSELGHGSTGARSTGMTQSEPWYDLLHSVADYIGEVMQTAIKRLVDANYQVDRYPSLVGSDIEARSIEQYAQGVAQLLAADGIVPDKSFRNWLRELLDAPDEDDPGDGVETDELGRPQAPTPPPLEDVGPNRRPPGPGGNGGPVPAGNVPKPEPRGAR